MSNETVIIIARCITAFYVCPAKQLIAAATIKTSCRCAKIGDASDWLSNSAIQTYLLKKNKPYNVYVTYLNSILYRLVAKLHVNVKNSLRRVKVVTTTI
jgi:hypothetical protein